MDYRALRIFTGPVSAALLAIFVIGGSASPAAGQCEQPAFQIFTPDVSDVVTEDVSPAIARDLNMACPVGVVVTDVLFSPLQPGDVILAVNGNPVSCQNELNYQLGQLGSEQTFTVDVLRNGIIQPVTVQRAMKPIVEGNAEARGITV